jgi:hypothetical protein
MSNYKNTVTNQINAVVADTVAEDMPKGLFAYFFRRHNHEHDHTSPWYHGYIKGDYAFISRVCADMIKEDPEWCSTECMVMLAYTATEVAEKIGAEYPA